MNYSEPTKELTLDLNDRRGLSTLFIKIPKSMIKDISTGYEHNSENNISNSNITESESPYHLEIQRYDNYSIIEVQTSGGCPRITSIYNKRAKVVHYAYIRECANRRQLKAIRYWI